MTSAIPALAPLEPSGWARVPGFPPLLDARLAAVYDELRRDNDPANWFFSNPDPPPAHFSGWTRRVRGRFPGVTTPARVVAHTFGEGTYPRAPLLDAVVPGCGAAIVDARGRRCPSVRHPGIELSPEQIAELLAIVNTPNDVRSVVMDGYHFMQGFVFFDAKGAPVAELLVNQGVNKIMKRPIAAAETVEFLAPARRERLRALLDALGVRKPPLPPDIVELLNRQASIDAQERTLRYLPATSGVLPSTKLASVDDEDALRLCYFYARAWQGAAPHAGAGFECADGFRAVGQAVLDCTRTFPRCDATVGEVEDCMRRQRLDTCYTRPENAHCTVLRDCFWGFVPTPPAVHGCDPWSASFWLELTPRPTGSARRLLLDAGRWHSAEEPRCAGSRVYLRVRGAELLAMFGRRLELQGVPSAGNSTHTCGWFARLETGDFVPAAFASFARAVRIETDAKLELFGKYRVCGNP